MDMKNEYFYSKKFPAIRELTTAYYLATFAVSIILLGIFIFMKRNLAEKTILFAIIFIFLMIVIRLILIKFFIIKRIDQVLLENSTLSKKDKKYEGLLLQSDISYAEYRKKERVITIIFVLGFIFLSKIINIYSLDKPLISWSYIFIILSFQSLYISLNIFKYLSAIIQSCTQKIVSQKDFSDFKGKDIIDVLNTYIKKTKFFFLLFAVILFGTVMFFLQREGLQFLPIALILLIAPIIFNINRIINKIMPIFEQYDNIAKTELSLKFHPDLSDRDFAELSENMTKDIKDLFK